MKKDVVYHDQGMELTGYFSVSDTAKTPAPGILVVQEWWGHNDYVRHRADMLADLGYAAFALDMYGTGKVATSVEEAKAYCGPFYADRELLLRRATAGLDALKNQPQVDASKIAVIGYCFGGTVALELARSGADIKAAVSFHGGLKTSAPAEQGKIKAEVLALNGGADPFVPQEEKDAFEKEMTDADVKFRMIDYPGTTHAFTNPAATARGKEFGLPLAYDAEADKKSWEEMQNLFKKVFG